MGFALAKLAEEDPTFKTHTDSETGQTIIAGMGELHLEIIVDRLLREFKVEANVGNPQVSYKETIRKTVEVDHKYARHLNADGIIGVSDLQALIPQITKLVATGSYDAVADVNKDGTVDQFDIAALRQFMKNGFTTAAYLEMIGEDVDAAIAALKITDVADSIRFAKFVDDKLADKYETFLETRSTLNEYIADLYLEYATPASEQAA
jgi:hypothetical protein